MENTILSEASKVTNEAIQNRNEPVLSDDARNIALALSLASRDESIRSTPEMQELMGMIEKGAAEPAKPAPAKTPVFETPAEVDKPAESKEQTEPKSVFFSKEQSPEAKYDLTSIQGIQSYFKDNYGTDNVQEAISKVSSNKKATEQIEALTKQNEEVQDFLVNLPDVLYDAMEAHYHGRDWKSELAKATAKVDFTKPFDGNNEQDVVNHYFPGDFSAEDFTEKGTNEVLQKAITISKKSFERDSKMASEEKAALADQIRSKTESVRQSVGKSIEYLRKTFPEISENAVKKIEKSMISGDYKSIFFNQDGTFTNEAAKSIALAMYGDQEIRKSAKGAARQEANKVVEEVINRGSDKPKNTARNSPAPDSQDNTFMKFIGSYLPSNDTYSAKQ